MNSLRFRLLSDGSSDRALLPLLTWVLIENGVTCAIQPQWADLRRVRLPERTLTARIEMSVYPFPCDMLFIHRDAETQPWQRRRDEIQAALSALPGDGLPSPWNPCPTQRRSCTSG